jgi:ribosomal protein S18 acetylase RimI-like enzyme
MTEKVPEPKNPSAADQLEIISYAEELKDHIKLLNYEWLEKYFRIEEGDRIALSNPREEIIDKGGFIFFARSGDSILGTVSLIKKSQVVYELGKMAVVTSARGGGIGTSLLEYSIRFARHQGIEKLILYSNTQLQSALHLYRKFGFREITLEKGLYERANVKMELDLIKTSNEI